MNIIVGELVTLVGGFSQGTLSKSPKGHPLSRMDHLCHRISKKARETPKSLILY